MEPLNSHTAAHRGFFTAAALRNHKTCDEFPFFSLVFTGKVTARWFLKEHVCAVAVMQDDVALSFWKAEINKAVQLSG